MERTSLYIEKALKDRLRLISEQEMLPINQICKEFLKLQADEWEAEQNNESTVDSPFLYD